jgi:hypothetical protein
MFIVPLFKDTIKTKDGALLKVVEYTNFKTAGPAVYCKLESNTDLVLVYFFDIEEINSTRVEFQKSAKVFEALGKIKREIHLPQPDDKVVVKQNKIDATSDEKFSVEVKSLKLKSKSLGNNKGMFVKADDDNSYRIKDIISIDRSLGSDEFDRDSFLQIYKDYIGI